MRYISDRIAVIHKGDIVELADAEELVTHAIHPLYPQPAVGHPHAQPPPRAAEKAAGL